MKGPSQCPISIGALRRPNCGLHGSMRSPLAALRGLYETRHLVRGDQPTVTGAPGRRTKPRNTVLRFYCAKSLAIRYGDRSSFNRCVIFFAAIGSRSVKARNAFPPALLRGPSVSSVSQFPNPEEIAVCATMRPCLRRPRCSIATRVGQSASEIQPLLLSGFSNTVRSHRHC